jgi:hypothetical protein
LLPFSREDKEEKKQDVAEAWKKANVSRLVYPHLSGIYKTTRETDGWEPPIAVWSFKD